MSLPIDLATCKKGDFFNLLNEKKQLDFEKDKKEYIRIMSINFNSRIIDMYRIPERYYNNGVYMTTIESNLDDKNLFRHEIINIYKNLGDIIYKTTNGSSCYYGIYYITIRKKEEEEEEKEFREKVEKEIKESKISQFDKF